MDKNYKNIVLTNHAVERLKDRWVTPDSIWQVVNYYDKKFSQGDGTTKFIKTVNGRRTHAIATYLRPEQKWLIVSAWVRGEDDKAPLVWQIISLPFKLAFRLLFWLLKRVL